MKNVGEIIELMRSAIGNKDLTPEVDLYMVLNQAGRAIVNFTDWTWRVVRGEVRAKADSDTINLPDDFDQVVSVSITNSGYSKVTLTTHARIDEFYQNQTCNPALGYYIAFLMASTTGKGNAPPTKQALIWPLPTTEGSPTFRITYRKRWRDVKAGTDDSAVPNIEPEAELALIMMARALTLSYVEQKPADDAAANRALQMLAAADARRQVNLGPLSGTALGSSRRNDSPNVGVMTP